MISTAERGTRLGGLLRYLFGPGRHEEHHNQRVVACSDPSWVATTTPDPAILTQLIAELDDTRIRFGDRTRNGYVWHLIVALPATDGRLTDAQWREAGELFAARLGLDEHVAWVAVNHGLSARGNDHIHLVANLIRDNGRTVNLWRDAYTRRDVCRELETRFGLTATKPARAGVGENLSRAEIETLRAAEAAGEVTVLPRHRLATLVRAAASAARSETEFLEQLHAAGVIVRPRLDRADRSRVVGYSVALPSRQTGGGPLLWFGGGTLARDLRLPALRARWPLHPGGAPVSTWRSSTRHPQPPRSAELAAAARALHQATAPEPPTDPQQWQQQAEHGAGLLAAAATASTHPRLQAHLIGAWQALHRAGLDASFAAARAAAQADPDPLAGPPPGSDPVASGPDISVLMPQLCRVLLAVAREDNPTVRTELLIWQATQLAAQLADTLAATRDLATARQAAIAAHDAARAAAAVARPRGWLGPATPAPSRATDPIGPGTPTIESGPVDQAPTPSPTRNASPPDLSR